MTTSAKNQTPRAPKPQDPVAVHMDGPVCVDVCRRGLLLPDPKLPVLTPPEAVGVQLAEVKGEATLLRLALRPEALCALLDKAFTPWGWCCRRYSCGSVLYTALGLYNSRTGQMEYKDAPAGPVGRNAPDPAAIAADSGLARASAMWGICADVQCLPALRVPTEKVGVVPVPAKDGKTVAGYRLAQPLRVEQFARDEAGRITHVQFATATGAKFVWPES